MLQAQPRSPKPPALSPEPLQRARSRRPSTGGSLPSASAGAAGASGGLRLPCRRVNQDAHLRGGAGRSLHSPERGSCARLPTQILSSCPISWGPRFPWEEPKTGAPVPSCLEERSHSPSAGLSWGGGVPGLTLGGSSSCGAGFENKREFLRTRVDCSNRERSMNISLRWFKLSNNITKPSVLAGI